MLYITDTSGVSTTFAIRISDAWSSASARQNAWIQQLHAWTVSSRRRFIVSFDNKIFYVLILAEL